MSNFSENLSSVLHEMHCSMQDFSKQAAISPNTLSNILYDKVVPSEDSMKKILGVLEKHGYAKEDLFRENVTICNARICAAEPLSGNEKSALAKFLSYFEKKIETASRIEESVPSSEYSGSGEGSNEKCRRLEEFSKSRRIYTKLGDWLDYFRNPDHDTARFWGRPYLASANLIPAVPDPFELAESIGIKIGFENFGTKKISSFSTSIKSYSINASHMDYTPCIIINKDTCTTFESFRFLVAKEFYFIINPKYTSEYKRLSVKNVFLENSAGEGEKFAEEMLMPEKSFLGTWQELGRCPSLSFEKVTQLKHFYKVPADLVLKKLREKNLLDYTKEQYVAELRDFYEGTEMPFMEHHGEPLPCLFPFLQSDYFERILVAAFKAGMLNESDACRNLNCPREKLGRMAANAR